MRVLEEAGNVELGTLNPRNSENPQSPNPKNCQSYPLCRETRSSRLLN